MLHTRKPKQKKTQVSFWESFATSCKKKNESPSFLSFRFCEYSVPVGQRKKQRHHSCWRIKQLPYLHRFHTEYKRITAASRTCSKCFEKQARNSSLLLRSSATHMHGNGRFKVIKKKRKYSRATKSREETKNSGRKKTPAHRSRTKKKKRKVTNSTYNKQKLSSNFNNN